eukprot:g16895.t1
MNAFELTDIVTPYIMSWVSTVFWTIDFPTNFFLGLDLGRPRALCQSASALRLLRPAAPRATRAAPRGLSVPQLKVRTSSCVYETAGQLTEHLKRDPEVQLEASGLKVAEKSLRILSLAGADLQKCTGYLPGFGALGLRLDHFRATTLSTPCELRARVARLLEPPLVSDSIVQVVTKKSSWPGLAEGILHQLDGGEAALEHFAEHLGLSVVVSCGGNGERPGLRLALCPSLGFYRAGHIVIDPWKIAWQYLRTWFAVDVGVLALDWFFIFLDITMADIEEDTDAAGNNYFRIARMSRGLKVLRILRLVRLAKLFPKFHSAFIVVQSDFIRLSMGAWFAVVIVVVMNHYVACVWFALGYWDTQAPITWVKENDLDGVQNPWKVELTYQYSTSLHWALCQFTPATTEVMATNTTERIFTVLTIILGLISFSSFVSNITTSMTQLRNLNSEKHKLQSALRTYFSQNEVPPEVSKCIYDWIHSHRKMHRVRVHEQDIELLAEMPERLRFKLREAVYRPLLCRHPFLQEWCEVDQRGFDRLCHQALQEIRSGGLVREDLMLCCEKIPAGA